MCSNCSETKFYRAPSNIAEDELTCLYCGEQFRPDEMIGSDGEQYIHEECAAIMEAES